MKIRTGMTNAGNVAMLADDGRKAVQTKAGEIIEKPGLNFPDYILDAGAEFESFAAAAAARREQNAREQAAREEGQMAANAAYNKMQTEAGQWILSNIGSIHNAAVEIRSLRADRENIATLKKLLARAKKTQVENKAAAKFERVCKKSFARLANKSPKSPLKGIGNARALWNAILPRRHNDIVLAAIPSAHKDTVCDVRRQKGYFSSHLYISPEAAKIVAKILAK